MQTILHLQIVMASTRKPMHNWPGLRASTAVCCAAERNRREWIPFTERTETRPPKITHHYLLLGVSNFYRYSLVNSLINNLVLALVKFKACYRTRVTWF